MEDLILILAESGATHLLPFIILIVIIYALSNRAKKYDIAPVMGVITKMTAGLLFVVAIHLLEFLTETHRVIPLQAEEIYIEIGEVTLMLVAFSFFFWGLREVRKIIRAS